MNDAIVAQVLETLNRIEAKVDANHTEVTTIVRDHVRDEEVELIAIRGSVARSLALEEAFLKDAEGKPDLVGHKGDHKIRKTIGEWLAGASLSSLRKVFEYFTVGFFIWLVYAIWMGFLKGPVK